MALPWTDGSSRVSVHTALREPEGTVAVGSVMHGLGTGAEDRSSRSSIGSRPSSRALLDGVGLNFSRVSFSDGLPMREDWTSCSMVARACCWLVALIDFGGLFEDMIGTRTGSVLVRHVLMKGFIKDYGEPPLQVLV
jgi:hypothetical protein